MQRPGKRWLIPHPLPPEADQELSPYHPVLRQILYQRGYRTRASAETYLSAQPPHGNAPERLSGVEAAVDRIKYAISHHEPIAIYGDYDADGVTATALLYQALQRLNADARSYIPNRFDEGYGLNKEALTNLHQEGIKLVITVDCGIRSVEETVHARTIGLDLVITDHHHPGTEVPDALALINPKLPEDTYPDKDLAGVGLAYKLAAALWKEFGIPEIEAESFLDLVALGTVTDLAPLIGENRHLVRYGIKHIQRPDRQGVLSLIGVSRLFPAQINARDIAFMLGPRLNAAGRLDSALLALRLLNTKDPGEAGFLAQELDNQNTIRQRITREIQAKAEQLAFAQAEDPILLFAADPSFNPGVVGLAASRLTERYYRPAIVASIGDEYTRGSCRSIPEFHITGALDQCADLLHHYGGHAAAAGFTVHNRYLDELVERLNILTAQSLGSLDLRPELIADAEVALENLRPDLMRALEDMQPTGMGNRSALLFTRNAEIIKPRTVGQDSAHLKFTLKDRAGTTHDAIAFGMGHLADSLTGCVDLMFTYEKNAFNGQEYLQLNVKDIRQAENG
jgi:single-stranded-DNA-specific exonuclease